MRYTVTSGDAAPPIPTAPPPVATMSHRALHPTAPPIARCLAVQRCAAQCHSPCLGLGVAEPPRPASRYFDAHLSDPMTAHGAALGGRWRCDADWADSTAEGLGPVCQRVPGTGSSQLWHAVGSRRLATLQCLLFHVSRRMVNYLQQQPRRAGDGILMRARGGWVRSE